MRAHAKRPVCAIGLVIALPVGSSICVRIAKINRKNSFDVTITFRAFGCPHQQLVFRAMSDPGPSIDVIYTV